MDISLNLNLHIKRVVIHMFNVDRHQLFTFPRVTVRGKSKVWARGKLANIYW